MAAPEDQLNPNQYFELRLRQINGLRSTNNPDPYPHKFEVNARVGDFITKYEHLQTGETLRDVEIRVGVRIMGARSSGNSLRFYDGKAEGLSIQILCDSSEATDSASFVEKHNLFRRGDWIGVIGFPGRTNPRSRPVGELSVYAREVVLLAPCLHQLPAVRNVFTNQEQRYRQRYLDLIMNDATRKVFEIRTKIVRHIRRFLDDRGFLEVQTPILSVIPGGAAARPFKTFHRNLNMDMFLRVAPELPLKMLVIGGLERVYEIGQQFRNEDIDLTHYPEFTSCEFYCAFADMYDLLDLTEELVSGLVKDVTGSYHTVLHKKNTIHSDHSTHNEDATHKEHTPYEINWERPWRRVQMIPALEEATGETFPPADQLHTDEATAFLEQLLEKMKIECPAPRTNSRMIDKLVGVLIEPTCVNPTFIMGHPQIMSPLAKPDRNTPGLCERFELFVATKELANSYTELNDPVTQRALFSEQAKDKDKGDDEAQLIDENFCQSLEYGLPPTAGWGMGLDRLVMLLTDRYNIKEVLTFPIMKGERHPSTTPSDVG